VPRRNFQPRNHLPAAQTRLALEGPPIKVPVNATCEVEEPEDEEVNEDCEEFVEEVDDEADELEGSRVNFFTTEGIDDEDDYDEIVADMNSESYAVMTREQTNQREKVMQPTKKSKEQPTTIPVIAKRGSPIPVSSTPK
ncbi:hypothetical protein KI387_039959, partial [Taxus chinensis]